MNGGEALFKRKSCDSLPVSEHHVVSHEDRGLCFRVNGIVERQLKVLYALKFARKDLYAARQSRCADIFQGVGMSRKRRISKYRDFCRPGNCFKKQLKPLFHQSGFAIGYRAGRSLH